MRTLIFFFPLWLGLVLLLDGCVLVRTGTSMIRRSPWRFVSLFPMSFAAWWLFELLNLRTQNWEYLGSDLVDETTFLIFGALAFSTVMPAVLEAAELVRSFHWVEYFPHGRQLSPNRRTAIALFVAGCTALLLVLWLPRVFYALMWISIYLIVEGVNILRGNPNLLQHTANGDWRPAVSLALGAIACGFVWEMWNYASNPKWVYHTPGIQWLHIFEMPLLGYLGYMPFAWELHALHCLLCSRSPIEW